jgi:hypothetical protein
MPEYSEGIIFFNGGYSLFFSELNLGLTNACFTKPTPIPGFNHFESGIVIKKDPIPYILPAIGVSYPIINKLYFTGTLYQHYRIKHPECDRNPLGIALGLTYFVNKKE